MVIEYSYLCRKVTFIERKRPKNCSVIMQVLNRQGLFE